MLRPRRRLVRAGEGETVDEAMPGGVGDTGWENISRANWGGERGTGGGCFFFFSGEGGGTALSGDVRCKSRGQAL